MSGTRPFDHGHELAGDCAFVEIEFPEHAGIPTMATKLLPQTPALTQGCVFWSISAEEQSVDWHPEFSSGGQLP
jgi:hypothetical protein